MPSKKMGAGVRRESLGRFSPTASPNQPARARVFPTFGASCGYSPRALSRLTDPRRPRELPQEVIFQGDSADFRPGTKKIIDCGKFSEGLDPARCETK